MMLLLYPWPLVADWALGTVPLIEGWHDNRNMITILCFAAMAAGALAVLIRKPFDANLAFCCALIVIPFIPASNLFFPVGFVVAERVLYLPSWGWCILIGIGLERLLIKLNGKFPNLSNWKKLPKENLVIFYTLGIILIAFFARSYLRNRDWSDQVSLFRAGLRYNQRNAKLFNNVGHTYENDQKWAEAFAYFYKAVRTHPSDVGAHRNVARALKNMGHLQYSQRALRRAIRLIPTSDSVAPGTKKTRVTPNHLDAL